MIRRWLAKLAYPLASIVLVVGPVLYFTANPAEATIASVSYSITGDCIGIGGCTTHVTILTNPSNGGVRAWELCGGNGQSFYLYGGWHFSVGTTSNTASCESVRASTFVQYAGFNYPKSPTVQYQCYNFFAEDNKSGYC